MPRTQCKLLYVGNYLNPSFGLFSLHSQCKKSAGGLLHTPKRIPTFMVIALLSRGNNVFVDSLCEPALEPSIRTLGSLRISSMVYQ